MEPKPQRPNYCALLVGQKATGKSTLGNELAEQYAARTGKRSLIIDVNGSPAYAKHPLLTAKHVIGWKEKATLRVARYYDPDHDTMFETVANFRNGLVIYEDCTKYIGANPGGLVKQVLVDHRMWNQDVIFTFHALKFVPPFFWSMVKYVMLKKTQDTPKRIARLEDHVNNLSGHMAAWEAVMKHESQYHHEEVDLLT